MCAIIFTFLVFASAGPSSFSQTRVAARSSFQEIARQAKQATADNRLADAARLYRQALRLNASWKEGWWGLGTALYDQSRYAEAKQAFGLLAALDRENGSARLFLGLCEFELGEDSSALADIRSARALGIPDDPQVRKATLYDEAQLELRKSEFESAIATLRLLAREGARGDEVNLAWGMAMLRMAPQQLPAEGSPERSVVLRVGNAQALAADRQFDAARAAYQSVIDSAPGFRGIHYAFGRFLLDAHDVDSAIHEFKQEIANDPTNVMARLQIAAARYRTDSAAGLPFAQEAVRLSPGLPFGHYLLGLLYLDTGDAADAIPNLEIAQKAFPNEPKVYFALGSAYAKTGRKQDAAHARATFIRLNSSRARQPEATVYGEESAGVMPQQIESSTEKPH